MSRKRADLLFSAVVFAIVVWMVWEARDWAFRARLFPWTIGFVAVILAFLQLCFAVRNVLKASPEPAAPAPEPAYEVNPQPHESGQLERSEAEAGVVAAAVESAFGAGGEAIYEEQTPPEVVRGRTLQMVMWIMIFAIGIVLLGFELSAAVTTLAFLRVAAHERWRLSVAISLSVYVFFFVVFDYWLKIHFPEGWIAEALGLQSLDSYITGPIIRLLTRS